MQAPNPTGVLSMYSSQFHGEVRIPCPPIPDAQSYVEHQWTRMDNRIRSLRLVTRSDGSTSRHLRTFDPLTAPPLIPARPHSRTHTICVLSAAEDA